MAKRFKKGIKATLSMPVNIKGINKETFTLTMVASTQDPDRHGDTVMQAGWDIVPFIKNPVILNSHRYSDATDVIARAENVRIEGKGKKAKLIMEWVFAVNENPKAKIIFDLYAGKFLHASSVGFIPRKFAENPDGTRNWYIIEEAELLEVSAVSVPANAMALAKSKGLIEKDAELPDEMIGEDDPELEDMDDEEAEIDADEEETEDVDETTTEDEEEAEDGTEEAEEDAEEEEEVEIEPEEQEPEVPADEEKSVVAPKVRALPHAQKVLKAINSIQDQRAVHLKEVRATIDELLTENGLKTLSEETREQVRLRKVNQVIRKLMKCK